MIAPDDRPPYRAALAVAAAVLAVFVLTLAPTVTFWDAGELIAAARILGIPHPPGTPLFVLLAHAWGQLVPIGEWAYRTNLLSAVFSASAAGLFFLAIHQSLRGAFTDLPEGAARLLRVGGAAAAAMIGAFTFTSWQNSNETEVYTVATFTTAAMAWTAVLWRGRRESERAPRYLLLILYLAGLSIGNHLLALLAVPGVLLFLAATLYHEPAADPVRRRAEWGQVAVVAGLWVLLVGTGLGSGTLTALGALCFLAASVFAASAGAGAFAACGLLVAAAGVTPYLFTYLRAAQHPVINEAAPSTWSALLDVLRRAQYDARTPLDDPTVLHGPDNPGRSLVLIGWQLANYIQYFDWQWARSLADPFRTPITILFLTLGLRGFWEQRRSDRPAWWLFFGIFLATGLALVGYMNFKPGFSLALDRWPNLEDHEVRERDYFFVVSFIVWGLWCGIGAAAFAAEVARKAWGRRLAPGLLLLAVLVPLALNWTRASRRHGPDARLAADFAYDLLNSAPPYGVLFTYGDNDTFPLWWAQEVEGLRQDVTIVCLALANTEWYIRQLRDNPARPANPSQIPKLWRDSIPPRPDWPLHSMDDSTVASAMSGYVVDRTQQIRLGPVTRTLQEGSFLMPNELLSLSVVRENAGRRPLVWSVTTGSGLAGLGQYMVQRGLAFHLETAPPDTTDPDLDLRRLAGAPLHLPDTDALVFETYRYAGLLTEGAADLDPTSGSAAASLALPLVQLAYAYQARGDRERMERAVQHAAKVSPNPGLRQALEDLLRNPADSSLFFPAPEPAPE